MPRGRDKDFDGSYGSSRYAKKPLEDDIRRVAEEGIIVGETEDGTMFKENLKTGRVEGWVKGKPGEYPHAWDDPSTGDRGYRPAGSDKNKSCYLTTACLKHFSEHFDDNCHELTVLRWFRDRFVKPNDVAFYYRVAPLIIEQIDSLPTQQQDDIYASIYKNIVEACVNLIQSGQYESAYKRYMSSTLELQKQFLSATE